VNRTLASVLLVGGSFKSHWSDAIKLFGAGSIREVRWLDAGVGMRYHKRWWCGRSGRDPKLMA